MNTNSREAAAKFVAKKMQERFPKLIFEAKEFSDGEWKIECRQYAIETNRGRRRKVSHKRLEEAVKEFYMEHQLTLVKEDQAEEA